VEGSADLYRLGGWAIQQFLVRRFADDADDDLEPCFAARAAFSDAPQSSCGRGHPPALRLPRYPNGTHATLSSAPA